MSYNDRTETMKSLSQAAQDRPYESHPTTEGLTEEVPTSSDDTQPRQQKKKKCHGNRKAQHLRRRQHRKQQQQLPSQQEAINANLGHIDQYVSLELNGDMDASQECVPGSQENSRSENKRKRQESNKDDVQVNRSLSQLSISRDNSKKKKKATTATVTPQANNPSNNGLPNGTDLHVQMQNTHDGEEHGDEVPSNSYMQQLKPSYLQAPDRVFKQMLSSAIKDGDQLV